MNQIALAIHGAMLADHERNAALAAAISAIVRPGDVVVDVGAGSGLLSMLCVRAGARRVYALERSAMALLARRLIELNEMSTSIELVQMYSHQWTPPEQADVILCETLGFAALDEGFRASIVDARERMLRPGGQLLPCEVRILAVPVRANEGQPDITQLDTICGLNYRPLAAVMRKAFQRRYIAYTDELAAPEVLFCLNCYTMGEEDTLATQADFTLTRPGILAGFALWFEADLAPGIYIENRRPDVHNHWGQAYLPLEHPLPVAAGDSLMLTIELADRDSRFRISWDSLLVSGKQSPEEQFRAREGKRV